MGIQYYTTLVAGISVPIEGVRRWLRVKHNVKTACDECIKPRKRGKGAATKHIDEIHCYHFHMDILEDYMPHGVHVVTSNGGPEDDEEDNPTEYALSLLMANTRSAKMPELAALAADTALMATLAALAKEMGSNDDFSVFSVMEAG